MTLAADPSQPEELHNRHALPVRVRDNRQLARKKLERPPHLHFEFSAVPINRNVQPLEPVGQQLRPVGIDPPQCLSAKLAVRSSGPQVRHDHKPVRWDDPDFIELGHKAVEHLDERLIFGVGLALVELLAEEFRGNADVVAAGDVDVVVHFDELIDRSDGFLSGVLVQQTEVEALGYALGFGPEGDGVVVDCLEGIDEVVHDPFEGGVHFRVGDWHGDLIHGDVSLFGFEFVRVCDCVQLPFSVVVVEADGPLEPCLLLDAVEDIAEGGDGFEVGVAQVVQEADRDEFLGSYCWAGPNHSHLMTSDLLLPTTPPANLSELEATAAIGPPTTPMAAPQATSAYATLARTLHPRLIRFFKRWPPGTSDTPKLNPFTSTVNPATGKWQDPIYSLRRQADLCKLARKYGVETLLPPTVKSSMSREKRAQEVKKVTAKKVKGQIWERHLMAKYVAIAILFSSEKENWVRLLTGYYRVEKRKQAMLQMPQMIKDWKLAPQGFCVFTERGGNAAFTGKKGFVPLDRWEAWLASPILSGQPLTSPDSYLAALGQSLTDLFDKIQRTYPLITDPSQINLAGPQNRPPDLVTLNLRIIEGVRAIRELEEGPDESEVTDTEADEFGQEIRYTTGGPLLSPIHRVAYDDNGDKEPLETTLSIVDPNFNAELRRRFRDLEIELQLIADAEIELKPDIWTRRIEFPQLIPAFAALIDANATIPDTVPLQDHTALSLWVFNGNALSRDGDRRIVQYNTAARDDLRDAFDALRDAFLFIEQQLGEWLVKVEDMLVFKDRIALVEGHVVELQDFTWAYRKNCEMLFEIIDTGLWLPADLIGAYF
ncbi:54S ribosomal protein L25 [Drechslerella dactyloides]|uniref:54S ribosomal protein L25 n=1 Tax=Drechslerella dactyloides TaxID=74499 RepID=A0AAD6J460_DREDA|nr:54S ribosomal protein L25 [Drechslerella dactyloides]